MLPGTAKTSRPCSAAKRVVISAPLASGASVTTTPSDRPLIRRLRAGQLPASGWVPGANSVTYAPITPSLRLLGAFPRTGGHGAAEGPPGYLGATCRVGRAAGKCAALLACCSRRGLERAVARLSR